MQVRLQGNYVDKLKYSNLFYIWWDKEPFIVATTSYNTVQANQPLLFSTFSMSSSASNSTTSAPVM